MYAPTQVPILPMEKPWNPSEIWQQLRNFLIFFFEDACSTVTCRPQRKTSAVELTTGVQ